MTKEVKQQQGEPVGKFAKFTDGIWREVTDGSAGVPLYTHPKEWLGLTDFEKLMLDTNYSTYFIEKTDKEKNVTYVGKQVDMLSLLTAVEKILKEKNT